MYRERDAIGLVSFGLSARMFVGGMVRHWFVLGAGIICGALDGLERLFGASILIPRGLSLAAAGLALLAAATWAYHDLRIASVAHGDEQSRRSAVENALVAAHLEGQLLLTREYWGVDGAWKDWHHNTAEYIDKVLGPAQKERFLGYNKSASTQADLFRLHLDELLEIANSLQPSQIHLGLGELEAAEDERLSRSQYARRAEGV